MAKRIPIETLQQLLRLDRETGRLYWRERPRSMFRTQRHCSVWNARYAGKEAMTFVTRDGYRQGAVFAANYQAHVIVFALANGRWPEGEIDHRDSDGCNNRPDNLREATRSENCRNTRGHRNGTSRFKGVSWLTRERLWQARGYIAGKNKPLGLYRSEDEAARAYDAFARKNHGEFARLNFPEAA